MSGASSRAEQRAELGTLSGASSRTEHRQQDERSTVSWPGIRPGGASSADHHHWNIGAERSTVSAMSGVLAASQVGRCQRAEWSIVTGSIDTERSTVRETSGVPSASGAEHRHRSIGAKRNTVSEMSRVLSASGVEHRSRVERHQRDERSTDSEPSGALSARRTEHLHQSTKAGGTASARRAE
jgi:hypothetical protein